MLRMLLWISVGLLIPAAIFSQSTQHTIPLEERIREFPTQKVTLEEFEASGHILDLGGGGEGVIGRIKGETVVAIDISKEELEGAPAGPLKIVMDATDLQFLDSSFDLATSFFTLMYIPETSHKKVFSEICRVLKPEGRFLVWDVTFPARKDEVKDIAVFPMFISLPAGDVVETGYGVKWPADGRDIEHFRSISQETGFDVVRFTRDDQWFFIEFKKK